MLRRGKFVGWPMNLFRYMQEVSARLLRCVELIREGKDTVAMQEAQVAPPLMDVLDALSFAKIKEWGIELYS